MKGKITPLLSKITPDARDGRKDKFIPREKARELFEAGKLYVDVTNSRTERVYCPVEGNSEWMRYVVNERTRV
jgi:hypothetical protein